MEILMALKPITIRLDEEEYENLKQHLSKFGDPDINVAYVIRSYIRDLNRAIPYTVNTGWDLKNYFGFMGIWLKQFFSTTDTDLFSKGMSNWWQAWNPMGSPSRGRGENEDVDKGENKTPPDRKGGGDQGE
jgi:hypothetical protein